MASVVAVINNNRKRQQKEAGGHRDSKRDLKSVASAVGFSKSALFKNLSRGHSRSNNVTPTNPIIEDDEDPDLLETRKENCRQQEWVRKKYESNVVQIAVAVLIFANFIVSAIEKVILPEEDSSEQFVFLIFEWFFGVIFSIELAWNMYGSWWSLFWASGWNWFDFIIVLISLLSLGLGNLPGISVLRLFRAFRVFRLFKRVPSLKLIIEGVVASLPGVSNAFVVLGILMGIWSIMGVEFYSENMPEEFGNFFKAMFSMWQIMTMDSWASGIARPLIYEHGHKISGPIFFISYTFIAGIIMTNVVVAILLEKYLECTSKAAEAKAAAKAKKHNHDMRHKHPEKSSGSRNPKMKGSNKKEENSPSTATMSGPPAASAVPLNEVMGQLFAISSELKRLSQDMHEMKAWQSQQSSKLQFSEEEL